MEPSVFYTDDKTPTSTNTRDVRFMTVGVINNQPYEVAIPIGSEAKLEDLKQTARHQVHAAARRMKRSRKAKKNDSTI